MPDLRLFGNVIRISDDGSALVHRADGRGEVRIAANEVRKAGGFQVGDFVEFRVWPPGKAGGDALLVRRGRVLAALK